MIRVDVGTSVTFDQRIPLSGLRGDLVEVRGNLAVGIADGVEARLEGLGWQRMEVGSVDSAAPAAARLELDRDGDTSDVLDVRLATRVRLTGRGGPLTTAVQVAVTLPNAGNESGLGRDVTDVAASLLGAWRSGALTLAGEAGVALLGSPTVAGAQDDQARVGLAGELALRPGAAVAAEVRSGFGDEEAGNEIVTQVAAGGRLRVGGLWLDAAYRRAIDEELAADGFEAGLTAVF